MTLSPDPLSGIASLSKLAGLLVTRGVLWQTTNLQYPQSRPIKEGGCTQEVHQVVSAAPICGLPRYLSIIHRHPTSSEGKVCSIVTPLKTRKTCHASIGPLLIYTLPDRPKMREWEMLMTCSEAMVHYSADAHVDRSRNRRAFTVQFVTPSTLPAETLKLHYWLFSLPQICGPWPASICISRQCSEGQLVMKRRRAIV